MMLFLVPLSTDERPATSHALHFRVDKDLMSEALLKYMGAEAGEVDWRPMETIPEDYYAL